MKKKGQFQLGFGFIFSIILIAVFIVVAVIAIKAFLDIKCSTDSGKFVQDLRREVSDIWNGAGYEGEKNFKFQGCGVEKICFYSFDLPDKGIDIDLAETFSESEGEEGNHNLYFYPKEKSDIPSVYIPHVNMTSFNKNPYCISIVNNEIKIKFEKRLNEALVRIS